MLDFLYNIIALILPESGLRKIGKAYNWIYLNTIVRILIPYVKYHHKREIKRIKKKENIKVVFLVIFDSVWKYEGLYKLMEKDIFFDPIICVIPYTDVEKEEMYINLNTTYLYFSSKGYNVINTYNNRGKWIDVKKELKPDVVFFSVPYNYTMKRYTIKNFQDKLTCYVPYAFIVINRLEMHYSAEYYSLLWRYFCETDYHLQIGKSLMYNNAENMLVSGYPTFDSLKDNKGFNDRKVIVWAPHHTISDYGGGLDYSCFEVFSDVFLELAMEYRNEIVFVFKPHPLLIKKLKTHKEWGEDKVNAYLKKWEFMENCRIELGDYINLFNVSDALIHDSASFMAEYLVTEKPAAFTIRDKEVVNRINDFGKRLFDLHFKVTSKEELESFIKEVVLKENDYNKINRIKKLNEYFDKKISPSQFIFNELKKQIC
jgi:CDP-glycerol glycerophosphotransferase (TagB/SpsB family)